MNKLLSLITGLALLTSASVMAQGRTAPVQSWTSAVTTFGITSAVPTTVTLSTPPAITVDPQYGIGLMVTAKAAIGDTTTSNLTFTTKVSFDGTTWSTAGAPSFSVPLTGSNVVRYFYQIPPSTLANAYQIALNSIQLAATNNATAVYVSNVVSYIIRTQ